MAKSRICPECEKEVPLDASYYYCPYCFYFFDREKRNSQNSGGYQDRFKEQINFWLSFRWEYFISGLGGSAMFLALGYIFDIVELENMTNYIFPWFMSGFWAWFFGNMISKESHYSLSTIKIIGIVVLSALIGLISFLCNIF